MLSKYNAYPGLYSVLKEYAHKNRENPTEAEMALWKSINNKKLGVKFLRQFIIDQFIVDFICRESRLIIEVDGAYHSEPRQQIDDAQRTHILQSLGYRVIRFTNEEILFDIDKVLHTIIIEL